MNRDFGACKDPVIKRDQGEREDLDNNNVKQIAEIELTDWPVSAIDDFTLVFFSLFIPYLFEEIKFWEENYSISRTGIQDFSYNGAFTFWGKEQGKYAPYIWALFYILRTQF